MEIEKDIFFGMFEDEQTDEFKKGISYQREVFKHAMNEKEYDVAASSLENIKTEIEIKTMSLDYELYKKKYKIINEILEWYRNLGLMYKVQYQDGIKIQFPDTIEQQIRKRLYQVFGVLVGLLLKHGLIK